MKSIITGLVFFSLHFPMCIFSESYATITNNLVHTESRHITGAVGKAGEIGKFQISPVVLLDFNNFNKKKLKYTTNDLFIVTNARIVFNWQMKRLIKTHKGDMVKAINSYNMGPGNTKKGRYKLWYIKSILPNDFKKFLKRYTVVSNEPGTEIYYLRKKK